MVKCSFCEHSLACRSCGQPFRAGRPDTHLGVYQPDVAVSCPGCHKLLVCKLCGFAYGEPGGGDDSDAPPPDQ
jgi:hypothetical protein